MSLPPRRRPGIPQRPVARAEVARPAPRLGQRPVRRSASGGWDGSALFLRIGVLALIALIGGAVKMANRPSGDQRYFNAAAELSHTIRRQVAGSAQSVRKQVEALPISGVKDPKLKEFHQSILDLLKLPDDISEDDPRVVTLVAKYQRLRDEMNLKYGR